MSPEDFSGGDLGVVSNLNYDAENSFEINMNSL